MYKMGQQSPPISFNLQLNLIHLSSSSTTTAAAATMDCSRKPRQPNRLSKREMESLAAVCDTILPSIDVSGSRNDALIAFYGTSASMLDIPDKIGRLISEELFHPARNLVRLALWLLSTWLGTFCMCGRASLSSSFPFFQKFADVDQAEREGILRSWSSSSFYLYRMLFKCIKFLLCRLYFSEVNDKNYNPSWKALGYCGPDPTLTGPTQQQNDKKQDCVGPLHQAILPMDTLSTDHISHKLSQAGFPLPTLSPLTLRCDAVVVGSGSGGSVVAGLLASAGHKVIVLEKGGYFARNQLSLLEGPTSNEMYEGRGLIATDNLGTLVLAGSTVGGGSTVNWSACIRTPDHVRTEWRDEHGLDLFGSKVFDWALDAVCDKMGVQSDVNEEGFNNAVLRRGCEELGYHVGRVPVNAPSDHYCGWCHLGCKNGKKKSTQETWLMDLAKSGNGLILPGCRVVNIIRDGNIARGVIAESITDNNKQFVIESKVTVIACGALNTPGLLKRSGLKNKNIGRNLHIHPCVMAWGYFPAKAAADACWPEESKKSYQGGILTSMSAAVANFDTSGYGAIIQTPALHPGMFSALMPWTSAVEFRERMMRFPRTAHVFALARDKGTGSVDYPWTLTHRLDHEDEENLVRGLEVMLRVLVAAGAEEVGTQHCGGERVSTKGNEKGVERLIGEVRRRGLRDLATPISSAHQMGSCRMGVRPDIGAVRPNGETWEVDGLFIADTSVFPTALGVNPMVTVQAIAYCTAQSVLEALKREKNI